MFTIELWGEPHQLCPQCTLLNSSSAKCSACGAALTQGLLLSTTVVFDSYNSMEWTDQAIKEYLTIFDLSSGIALQVKATRVTDGKATYLYRGHPDDCDNSNWNFEWNHADTVVDKGFDYELGVAYLCMNPCFDVGACSLFFSPLWDPDDGNTTYMSEGDFLRYLALQSSWH